MRKVAAENLRLENVVADLECVLVYVGVALLTRGFV
jgi:hypothetical protein